jgi:prepilin-type N-terminal cleavage/methylation domain-containing protein
MIHSQRLSHSGSRRSGLSLLEMLLVLFLLSVLLGIGLSLLIASLHAEQRTQGTLKRIADCQTLADRFRADVHAARSTPHTFEDWTASNTCLLLGVGPDEHIIYQWKENRLERFQRTGKQLTRQTLPVSADCLSVEFAQPTPGLVVLQLREQPRAGQTLEGLELAAALGGTRP